MTRTVALLPIKAHSERVPGKNFRDFAGRPLYRWVLDTLLGMREIDEVVINTDGEDLLRKHALPDSPKLTLRERKREIRGDFVSMNRIIEDDIAAVPADVYLQTHATNPLLTADSVRRALHAFAEGKGDSLFTVTRHQARFYWADGRAVNHDPAKLIRTQDLEPLMEENSNLYLFTRASFAATNARIGKRPVMSEVPLLESIDIDDAQTWDLALALATRRS